MNEEQVSKPVRRRRSAAEADRLAAEFEASGLTRREFCRARGLTVSALDAYRRRRRSAQRAGSESHFLEVEADKPRRVASSAGSAALSVLLAGGRRIEAGHGFDAVTLRELVLLLERI